MTILGLVPAPTTVMLWSPKRPPRHCLQADTTTEAVVAASPLLPPTPRGRYQSARCTVPGSRFARCRAPCSTQAACPPHLVSHASALHHVLQTDTQHRSRLLSDSGRNHRHPRCQRREVPRLPSNSLPSQTFSASFAEQPTSRLYSTDESVAFRHRFQHRYALSIHGLCPHTTLRKPVCRSLPAAHRSGLPTPAPPMPEGAFVAAPSEESGVARANALPAVRGEPLSEAASP